MTPIRPNYRAQGVRMWRLRDGVALWASGRGWYLYFQLGGGGAGTQVDVTPEDALSLLDELATSVRQAAALLRGDA